MSAFKYDIRPSRISLNDLYSFGINRKDDHGKLDDITNWSEINDEFYGGWSAAEYRWIIFCATVIPFSIAILIFWVFRKSRLRTANWYSCSTLVSILLLVITSLRLSTGTASRSYLDVLTMASSIGILIFSISGLISNIMANFHHRRSLTVNINYFVNLMPWLFIGLLLFKIA